MPGRHQETPSASLGSLLLRGHTMLAEACPACNIPLMRDPATQQSLCVSCQRSYSPAEVQALAAGGVPAPAAASPEPAAEPEPAAAAASGPLHSRAAAPAAPAQRPMNGPLTSALARRDHRRTTSNSGSSDGGGAASPILTVSPAPTAPAATAATPSAAGGAAGGGATTPPRSHTAAVPHSYQLSDSEVLQAYQQMRAERQQVQQQVQQPSRPRQPPQQLNGAATPAAAAPPQGQRDVTQLLADKMLAGWCLLGDHCPICSTPLMRERGTRQIHCVACNLPVHVEQQQQATAPPAGSVQPAAAAPAIAVNGTSARAVRATAAAAPTQLSQAAGGGASRRQQVYQQLHESLLDKLHAVQQDMAATPSSQLEHLRQQLQVVQLLHQTLESCVL